MSLPASAKYLVIGAGVHGLSTAWHLAKEQRSAGEEPEHTDEHHDEPAAGDMASTTRTRPHAERS